MNKTYNLTINNQLLTLTLALPPPQDYCVGCWKTKEIKIISQPQGSFKQRLCQTCALDQLDDLWEMKFENQSQIIKEVRQFLLTNVIEKPEILECYG